MGTRLSFGHGVAMADSRPAGNPTTKRAEGCFTTHAPLPQVGASTAIVGRGADAIDEGKKFEESEQNHSS
jgi:hypothetical protein